MKKSMLAFAALSLVSGIAAAQSSVTVFGVLDVGARSLKGVSSVKYLHQGWRVLQPPGFPRCRRPRWRLEGWLPY